jgi:glycerol uptake facilitator protein
MKTERKEFAGELFGAWVLIVSGGRGKCAVTLSGETAGSFVAIRLRMGAGWRRVAVYVAGKMSGAHLNPALTDCSSCIRQRPKRKVGPYIAGTECWARF